MPITDAGFRGNVNQSAQDLLETHGPTMLVQIGFDAAYDPNILNAVPQLSPAPVPALIDTGAMESCIDIDLANKLQLPIVDKAIISGAGGKVTVPVFMAQIFVPTLGQTQYGRFAGVHLAAGGQHHCALLGRTFLRSSILFYDGRSGQVTIAR